VYIATAPRRPQVAAPSIVFVDDDARVLEQIPLERVSRDGAHLALRGIVYALWKARRLGYRRLEMHSDDPAAAAQINGERDVDPDAIGLYLEARALMHLYTSARIDVGELLAPAARAACGAPPAASATPASS
jgi:hypothetical protein